MKPKTIILMAVAIVCGLGASYMTSQLLAERDKQPEVVEVPKVTVLYAKKNLEAQTKILKPEELFEEKQKPKDDVPANAISQFKDLKGKYLKNKLRGGDHLTAEDLVDYASSLNLPDGMVATGLRVTIDGIAGGFASLPGSRVDLIWMVRRGGDSETYTRVLLQDVLVLAADTEKNNDGAGGARPASVVTVALNREDTLKLALAKELGPISLALRKYGDESKMDITKVDVKSLIEGGIKKAKDEEPEPKVLPNPEPGEKPVEAPKWKIHVVTHTANGKVWKQRIKIDEEGRPFQEEEQPEPAPRLDATPPVLPPPNNQPAVPKKDGDNDNAKVKNVL